MSARPTSRGSRHRHRGVALAAVLVVGLGLLLLAVGLLHVVRAEVAAISSGEARVQSRFAARAATRAVMATLAADRAAVLDAGSIDPPASIELFEIGEGESARLAVARLLPIGPGGARLIPEASRLDLNLVDADALVATGLVDRVEADTIVAARDARPGRRFASVLDLLALEGDGAVGPTRVIGPLEEIRLLSRVDAEDEDVGERIAARLDADLGSGTVALVDVLTVHAFEPDVGRDGRARIRVGAEADEPPRLDEATAALVRAVLAGEPADPEDGDAASESGPPTSGTPAPVAPSPVGGPGATIARIAPRMPDADLGAALDLVTGHDGGWRNGLLDINTASVEALQGIDGIDADLASAIVARRETVPEERRFDRFWPVAEDLVDLAIWGDVVDRITTRCTVWRGILAVGTVPVDDVEAPLESPLVWEVVVDLGSPRPRLVEVRDVTLLEIVARLVATGLDDASDAARWAEAASNDEDAAGSPLFADEPLFGDEPLFADDPLFGDEPLFTDDPMFGGDPLFDDDPLFATESGGTRTASPNPTPDAESGPRDRGPGGRWRPATSSR